MKRKLVLATTLAASALVVGWLFRDQLRPSEQAGLRSVRGRPGLVVTTSDGKSVDLSKGGGKVSLIHFWATWCQPCVEELPELAAFWRKNSARKDVRLYAIAVDQEGWTKVRTFLEEQKIELPVYLDPGGKVAERFGTKKYPETYVVNRKGAVLDKATEAIAWNEPDVQTYLDRLVSSSTQ